MTTYTPNPNDVPAFPADAFDITPGATDLAASQVAPQGITVLTKTTGDVTVVPMMRSTPVVFTAVPAYFILRFRVRSVTAATASCVGLL